MSERSCRTGASVSETGCSTISILYGLELRMGLALGVLWRPGSDDGQLVCFVAFQPRSRWLGRLQLPIIYGAVGLPRFHHECSRICFQSLHKLDKQYETLYTRNHSRRDLCMMINALKMLKSRLANWPAAEAQPTGDAEPNWGWSELPSDMYKLLLLLLSVNERR